MAAWDRMFVFFRRSAVATEIDAPQTESVPSDVKRGETFETQALHLTAGMMSTGVSSNP